MTDFNKMKEFMQAAEKRQKNFNRPENGVDWFVMQQDGSYEARILDIPMMTSGSHWGILTGFEGRKGGPIKCPKIYDDSPCPACEVVEMLAVSADTKEREQAKKWKARAKYPIVLVDLNEDSNLPRPRIWEATYQALEAIHSWGSNPKYGDITHPENGRNITIVKSTVKKGAFEYAEYDIQPDPDRTSINLEGVVLPDLHKIFKPRSYEDIEYAMQNGQYPKLPDQESFEEEEKPAPKVNRFTKPSKPTNSKPAPTQYSKGLPVTKTLDEEAVEESVALVEEEFIPETVEKPATLPAVTPSPKAKPALTAMLQGRLASLKGNRK